VGFGLWHQLLKVTKLPLNEIGCPTYRAPHDSSIPKIRRSGATPFFVQNLLALAAARHLRARITPLLAAIYTHRTWPIAPSSTRHGLPRWWGLARADL
jgi:hypothetical protein